MAISEPEAIITARQGQPDSRAVVQILPEASANGAGLADKYPRVQQLRMERNYVERQQQLTRAVILSKAQ